MRRVRLPWAALAVVAAASGITGVALAPAIPASAVTSCTGVTAYTDTRGYGVLIPTIGNNTYRDNCQLGLGNDSVAVRYLQYALNNCYYAGLALDGIYGPKTQRAVEIAQFNAGIPADGIYGPQTRDHILWYDIFGDCARL